MKFTKVLAAIILLSLAAVPVMAELNDYQKGVMDGMKAGMTMGKLVGAAPYDPAAANNYNGLVDRFNQGLADIFGDNQTAIQMFRLSPYGSAQGEGYNTANSLSFGPIHAIDASFNQSRKVIPDAQGQIHGYDPDTYYTMVGMDPNAKVPNYNSYTSQDAYGNLGGV